MGARDFYTTQYGVDAKTAFEAATHQARYENGHGGYTGTIAEKYDFVMITPPPGINLENKTAVSVLVAELIAHDASIQDKWGPAGCIDLGPRTVQDVRGAPKPARPTRLYAFFGWASS